MKINKIEIKDYKTEYLIHHRKTYTVCAVIFLVFTLLYAAYLIFGSSFMFETDGMWVMIPIGLAAAGGFGYGAYYSLKLVKEIKKELAKREISDEQRAKGSAMSKRLLIVSIIIIIVGVIFFVSTILGGTSSSGYRSGECGSCGRSWSAGDIAGNYRSIARTGMCKNCARNYKSMQGALDYYYETK